MGDEEGTCKCMQRDGSVSRMVPDPMQMRADILECCMEERSSLIAAPPVDAGELSRVADDAPAPAVPGEPAWQARR